MTLTFNRAPFSSAMPVGVALAELDVPHEVVTFDLKKTEHKQSEFLKLNPNGKVPTLVIDGTPLFEALAILQWLGDRYGVEPSRISTSVAPFSKRGLRSRRTCLARSTRWATSCWPNVVQYGVVCAVPVDDYPKTKAWLAQCLARLSFKREWD